MDKQKEALKLALEALEWFTAAEPGDEPPINAAITSIREALAHAPEVREQPAPVPKAHKQQEPVAKVCHDLDGHIGWNPKLTQLPDEGTPLYTSPPASKPWEGLTEKEENELWEGTDSDWELMKRTEAKLREKNAS